MSGSLSAAPAIKKSRIAVKDSQRKALRDWYNDHSNGKQSLESCSHWWQEKYGYALNKSTCCEILSNKYARLDQSTSVVACKDKARESHGDWPVLEEALFEWEQRYQGGHNTLTDEILRLKAIQFWDRLPGYQGKPVPKFSSGWLERFKKRHNIRQINQHSEAASGDRVEHTVEIMAEIREATQSYNPEDTFNMDETGYFWKMMPDRSISTERVSVQKAEKARLTAALTCNATGSRKLPIWFIGKANRPLSFRAASINGLESLGAFWRHNSTAWMVSGIMKEYLRWFDGLMERPTLLLMDNFSAHKLAYETFHGDNATEGLRWTTVIWLPPSTTSLHQPLDQGIIQNWKAHVRHRFVHFMVEKFDAGKDPKTSMHLLRAIRWGISAWENDVSEVTIKNCWTRSQCYKSAGSESIGDKWFDSRGLMIPIINDLIRLETQGQIGGFARKRLDILTFLNPVAEDVDDHEEDVFEAIVARYQEELEAESDEEVMEEAAVISISEAISASKVLRTYEEQQGSGDPSLTKALRRREREMKLQKTAERRQGNLKD